MNKKQIMSIRLQAWNAWAIAFNANIPCSRICIK